MVRTARLVLKVSLPRGKEKPLEANVPRLQRLWGIDTARLAARSECSARQRLVEHSLPAAKAARSERSSARRLVEHSLWGSNEPLLAHQVSSILGYITIKG